MKLSIPIPVPIGQWYEIHSLLMGSGSQQEDQAHKQEKYDELFPPVIDVCSGYNLVLKVGVWDCPAFSRVCLLQKESLSMPVVHSNSLYLFNCCQMDPFLLEFFCWFLRMLHWSLSVQVEDAESATKGHVVSSSGFRSRVVPDRRGTNIQVYA